MVSRTGSDTGSSSSCEEAEGNTHDEPDATAYLRELKSYTSSLMDLLPDLARVLERSKHERHFEEAEQTSTIEADDVMSAAAQPYAMKIYGRFPKASRAIAQALAEANWHRYKLIRNLGSRDVPQVDLLEPSGCAQSAHPSSAGFHDSASGSSIKTPTYVPTVYAETLVSTLSQKDGTSARVPPVPKAARDEQPFDCPTCGKLTCIRSYAEWKYVIVLISRGTYSTFQANKH